MRICCHIAENLQVSKIVFWRLILSSSETQNWKFDLIIFVGIGGSRMGCVLNQTFNCVDIKILYVKITLVPISILDLLLAKKSSHLSMRFAITWTSRIFGP